MSIKFSQFVTLCSEAYDADLMRSSTIRRQRDTAARRRTPAEIKRTKTEVNPETGERRQVPVVQKTRKDAGQARPQSTKSAQEQQPTQERGSAEVKKSYAEKEKERRRAAARARAAAKSGGAKPQSSSSSSKDLETQANKLLKKKKEEKPTTTKRSYKQRTEKGSNLTTKEKKAAGDSQRNRERGRSQQEIKKQMIADFTEKHGRPPKGKEKMKIVGDSHAAAKALK